MTETSACREDGITSTGSASPSLPNDHPNVTLAGSEVKPDAGQSLYDCLKNILLFCKLIGLVPLLDSPESHPKRLSTRER